jgi:hypothetical protein
MKKLPESDMTFREIISEGRLYVDKTRHVHKILDQYNCCFLARPKGFGKTLLIDVLEELFRGNRELFEGLLIDPARSDSDSDATLPSKPKTDYDFKKRPVIRINMADVDAGKPGALKKSLNELVHKLADSEKLQMNSEFSVSVFGDLLSGLSEKHQARVVVLIDDYDAPVTENFDDPELALANAKVLNRFYGTLKTYLEHIRFSFLTGETRFGLIELAEGINNIFDLSLHYRHAGVCSFSIPEVKELFKDRMEETLKVLKKNGEMESGATESDLFEKIQKWYGGYYWLDKEQFFNPYSILNFFAKRSFGPYWPHGEPSKHLIALIQENPMGYFKPRLDGFSRLQLLSPDFNSCSPARVLFHSGHLTYDRSHMEEFKSLFDGEMVEHEVHSFKFPNAEVANFYESDCVKIVFGEARTQLSELGPKFIQALSNGDANAVAALFKNLLSAVPNRRGESKDLFNLKDHYYASLFQIALAAAGLELANASSETDWLWCDVGVQLPGDAIALIEVKYVPKRKGDVKKDKMMKVADALTEAARKLRYNDCAKTISPTPKKRIGLLLAVYGRKDVEAALLEDSEF